MARRKSIKKSKDRATFHTFSMENIKNDPQGFVGLYPKISIISFILILFIFLAPDIDRILAVLPLLYNYFFGIIILVTLILTWNKNKLAGKLFIVYGILYAFLTWNKILAVSTISTAFWLCLTGVLFFVAEDKSFNTKKLAVKKVKETRRAMN